MDVYFKQVFKKCWEEKKKKQTANESRLKLHYVQVC